MKKFLVGLVLAVTGMCAGAAELLSEKYFTFPVYTVEVGSDMDGEAAKVNKALEMAFKHAKTTEDLIEMLQAADVPKKAIRGAVIMRMVDGLPKADQEAFHKLHDEAIEINVAHYKRYQTFFTWVITIGISALILIVIVGAAWALTSHMKSVNEKEIP